MNHKEIFGITLNAGILAIFYTVLGGVLSAVSSFIFKPYDPEWESQTLSAQLIDIALEVASLGIIGFWVSYVIHDAPPVFSVSIKHDHAVDNYISGVFFAYSLFLFVGELDDKIRFVYHRIRHA